MIDEVEPTSSLAVVEQKLEETLGWINNWQAGFQNYHDFFETGPRIILPNGYQLSVTKGELANRFGMVDTILLARKALPGQRVLAKLYYQEEFTNLRAICFGWYAQEDMRIQDETIILDDGKISEIVQLALPATFFPCGLDDPRLREQFTQIQKVSFNYQGGSLSDWQAGLGFMTATAGIGMNTHFDATYLNGGLYYMKKGLFHFPAHLDPVPTLSNFGRHGTNTFT